MISSLLKQIRSCTICAEYLPHGVRPVIQFDPCAKILIAGQAPGRKVHESGIPFDDASGHRLRDWLGVDNNKFYDPKFISILPIGFCYPGTGISGDLPPRPECAPTWRQSLMDAFSNLELTIIIGKYAMDWHLPNTPKNLTEAVLNWPEYWPSKIVLPHPSTRNNIWLKKNTWFDKDIIPLLRMRINQLK